MNTIRINCQSSFDAEALCHLLTNQGHNNTGSVAVLLNPIALVVQFGCEDPIPQLRMIGYEIDVQPYDKDVPPLPDPKEFTSQSVEAEGFDLCT